MTLWDPDMSKVIIKTKLASVFHVQEVETKKRWEMSLCSSLVSSPQGLGRVVTLELMQQNFIQTETQRRQRQLGEEEGAGKGASVSYSRWVNQHQSWRLWAGLSVSVALWLCVASMADSGQKKLWWTGEKPALQPLCLTGLTGRLSGPLAMGSVSHLWTFWAVRRWSQFFSQCGYWLSRIFLKDSHGMFPCSVHILLHLWFLVKYTQSFLCKVDHTSAAKDKVK